MKKAHGGGVSHSLLILKGGGGVHPKRHNIKGVWSGVGSDPLDIAFTAHQPERRTLVPNRFGFQATMKKSSIRLLPLVVLLTSAQVSQGTPFLHGGGHSAAEMRQRNK